jgi:hypothetical protein
MGWGCTGARAGVQLLQHGRAARQVPGWTQVLEGLTRAGSWHDSEIKNSEITKVYVERRASSMSENALMNVSPRSHPGPTYPRRVIRPKTCQLSASRLRTRHRGCPPGMALARHAVAGHAAVY